MAAGMKAETKRATEYKAMPMASAIVMMECTYSSGQEAKKTVSTIPEYDEDL